MARSLHEADLVIAIGCMEAADTPDPYRTGALALPMFGDATTYNRFRPRPNSGPRRRKLRRRWADEVRWLMGVRFTIQVVPGAGGELMSIFAGELDAVTKAATIAYADAWSCAVAARADLVVATIEGGPAEQTWDNFAAALAAAARVADADIALCTQISEPLPAGLQQFAGDPSALKEIARERLSGRTAVFQLARALERSKVYLISQLQEAQVEELGIQPLAQTQLTRLAARYDSTIVLENAHRASPSVVQGPT